MRAIFIQPKRYLMPNLVILAAVGSAQEPLLDSCMESNLQNHSRSC